MKRRIPRKVKKRLKALRWKWKIRITEQVLTVADIQRSMRKLDSMGIYPF